MVSLSLAFTKPLIRMAGSLRCLSLPLTKLLPLSSRRSIPLSRCYAVMTSEDSCSLCVPIHKFNGYGVWGPMTKELRPKFDAFTFQVNSQFGFHIPEIQI
ncbi:hypothetical protein S245_004250 [Arachis hypogaea]